MTKQKRYSVIIAVYCLLAFATANAINFDEDNLSNVSFPKDFLFGVMQAGPNSELSNTHNQLPDNQLLSLVQPLQVNAFQFAVNWRAIEPEQGRFNKAELERIAKKCQDLKDAGIKVVVTLHHYSNPDWFNARNGFEKEENNKYFVHFAQKVFEYVGERVDMVCTFHQPAGYALTRFYRGEFPPYKKNLQLALEVLKNMLDTHVLTYASLKSMQHGNRVKIGLIHQMLPVDPYYTASPIDQIAAVIANKLTNKLTVEFFATGNLSFVLPFGGSKYWIFAYINHTNLRAPRSLDFFGMSYLSHMYMKNFTPTKDPEAPSTDHELFTIYPQGLYDSIMYVAQLGLPIHILGNGIADAKDFNREDFLKKHIYAVSQAVANGYDVKSYFYRFLEDDQYDSLKFGLYEIDQQSLQRSLRPSAAYLIKVVSEHKKKHGQA